MVSGGGLLWLLVGWLLMFPDRIVEFGSRKKKLNLKPFSPFSDFFAMSRLCTQLLAFQNNIQTVMFAGNWTNYRKTSFLVPKCWKTLTISKLCFENVFGKLEERCSFLKAYFSKRSVVNFSIFFQSLSFLHTWIESILKKLSEF